MSIADTRMSASLFGEGELLLSVRCGFWDEAMNQTCAGVVDSDTSAAAELVAHSAAGVPDVAVDVDESEAILVGAERQFQDAKVPMHGYD